MARTKATARRKGSGPNLAVAGAPSKVKSKSSKKGKPMRMLQGNQRRRIAQGSNVLREIRKAQKAVGFAMTMAPFQRLVREICDSWGVGFRWSRIALLTLQEAAEDFLIEFFQDTMLVAAHAHRVTIMKKDINTLVRVRYRYDKILNAEDWDDLKMRDILLIPPSRKPSKDAVKVEDITHSYETRGKSAYEELLKQQVIASSSALESKTITMELKIKEKLLELGPRITIKLDASNLDLEFSLTKDCIAALSERNTYVTDTIILAAINMFKRRLHPGVMQKIFIADPAISFKLRDHTESSKDIATWFTFCNFEEVEIIFLPYHSNSHWSFVSIDLEQKRRYTFNSVASTHKELGLVLKRLFDALDLCPPNSNLLNSIEPIALQTPQLTDAYSCGWRLLITAKCMLDSYFGEKQPKFMQEDSFGSDYVYSFRANTILMLLRYAYPIPSTPLNVAANILDGFQKDSKPHSNVPIEIEMEARNMESSGVTEERKEKPRESQGKPFSESLDPKDPSQAQPKLESQI